MCPCPFCTTVFILSLILFKKPREWLRSKIKKHHKSCEVCQKAEHEQHLHRPCQCNNCVAKRKKMKTKTSHRAKIIKKVKKK